jgi:D-amino peptidase
MIRRRCTTTSTARLGLVAAVFLILAAAPAETAARQAKVFVSVDMEGIGGIGTGKMTSGDGKDYALGRELMTEEVNTVVAALFANGATEVLVNDSHGDMQNLLHTRLDPRVQYIQGNIKPLGMVQGLDASFDAAVFVGYHSRAGTDNGFLAHTGSGSVKGLWVNGVEVGEGGMNAYFAGAQGVPVILASGDSTFTTQFRQLVPTRTVATKEAIGAQVARLYHPDVVRRRLTAATKAAMSDLANAKPLAVSSPVTVRMRFATTTRADILARSARPSTRARASPSPTRCGSIPIRRAHSKSASAISSRTRRTRATAALPTCSATCPSASRTPTRRP